jgi:hypothetical protein
MEKSCAHFVAAAKVFDSMIHVYLLFFLPWFLLFVVILFVFNIYLIIIVGR